MQVIDSSQQRYVGRLPEEQVIRWRPEKVEENCYSHIIEAVERVSPDLIIITGDIVYGQFDDSGRILRDFLRFMGELNIPWAPVFGNHDNESKLGVDTQCQLYAAAKNCLFSRGNLTGNSNYTIGIYEDSELKRILYMMDTNGCLYKSGFAEDQIEWLKNTSQKVSEIIGTKIPGFLFCHIPTADYCTAIVDAGYQTEEELGLPIEFSIGEDRIPASPGDCGKKKQELFPKKCAQAMEAILISSDIDGVFAGHFHRMHFSIQHGSIRYTLGVKCGTYDFYTPDQLGGTKILLESGRKDYSVEYVYHM